MSKVLENRSEFIFLYDIKDANPNGDPLEGNKPRIDEETGYNLVTDVRIKRTSRDYLYTYEGYNGEEGKDIFIREINSEKSGIQDGKTRAKNFGEDAEQILKSCIDIRMYGGVIPLNNNSITYTGPIQLQMGRSMHAVEVQYIKGTGAFASKDGKKNATFREEYILPYSLINVHGIINEQAAQATQLTDDDVVLFTKSLWEGTKNLITRSKFGQMPRLLVKVNYNQKGFFIGDIQKLIKLVSNKKDEQIRDIDEIKIDVTLLAKALSKNSDKIESVEYKIDERLEVITEGEQSLLIDELVAGKMKAICY